MKTDKDPNILCVDIESTCWLNEPTPQGMRSEIIEVGYAVLNYESNEITERGSIFVKPIESTISTSCQQFTGITQERVDNGVSFEEACRTIEQDLRGGSRIWCSCGDYDRGMFEEQCNRRGIKYPFIKQHLNIKPMCTILSGKQVKGLGSILTSCGLQFIGRKHSGADDAYNVARIVPHYKAKFGEKILA